MKKIHFLFLVIPFISFAQETDSLVKMYNEERFQEIVDTYGPVSIQEEPEVLKGLAFSYFKLLDDEAFEAIDKAISLADDKIDYYYVKSQFYRMLKDFNKEIEVLKKILEIKESAEYLHLKFEPLLYLENATNAHKYIEVLKKILEIKESAEYFYLMVEPHIYSGDATNAHKYIDKAIALAENKLSYYLVKSDVFLAEDKGDEAIALLENLLKQEENDVVKFKLAQIYSYANKYELAIATLQEMLERLPDNEEIALEIYNTSFSNKKYSDGIEYLKTFIKKNGGSRDTFYALAQLYSKNNDYENSKYSFNKAIDLPNNSEDQIKSLVLSMAQNDIDFFEFDNALIGLHKLYSRGLNENKEVLERLIISNYSKGAITDASTFHSELLKLNQAAWIADRYRLIAKIPYNSDKGYIEIFEMYKKKNLISYLYHYYFFFYNTKFSDTVSYTVKSDFEKPIYQQNKNFEITIINKATATEKKVSYTGEAISYPDIIKFIKEQVEIFKKE